PNGRLGGQPKVGAVVYSAVVNSDQSDPPVSCSGSPTLTCNLSQLPSLHSFTLTVIFSTNASAATGEQIYPDFTGNYAPESQNGSNKRTPPKTYSVVYPDNSASLRG